MRCLHSIRSYVQRSHSATHQPTALFDDSASVERLEDRRMLAGNVKVVFKPDEILITGDGRDNYVQISTSNAEGGAYLQLIGLEDASGVQTTVNGESGPVTLYELNSGPGVLKIKMKGGDDLVEIRQAALDGDLEFIGAGGSDSLALFDSSVAGNAVLSGAGGRDFFDFVDTEIQGHLEISAGGGFDFIGFANSEFDSGEFIGGGGVDMLYFADMTINADVVADMGGLPDIVFLDDGVTMNGSLDITFGGFWDMLAIEAGATVNGPLTIDYGPGGKYGDVVFTTPGNEIINNVADVNVVIGDVVDNLNQFLINNRNFDPDFDIFAEVICAHEDRGFDLDEVPLQGFDPDCDDNGS